MVIINLFDLSIQKYISGIIYIENKQTAVKYGQK